MQTIFWHHHKIAEEELHKGNRGLGRWFWSIAAFFGKKHSDGYISDKPFLRFYLNANVVISIQLLSLNVLLLLLTGYVIAQNVLGIVHVRPDPLFAGYQGALVEIAIWAALSLLCLLHQLVLAFSPSLFGVILMSDESDVWYELAATVLATRLLTLVVQLTNMVNSSDTCLDASDLIGTGDTSFGYTLIKIAVDTFQVFAYAILPFPQPWMVGFAMLELVRQELRLWTCAGRISNDPGHWWIVQLAGFLLVMVYVTLLIIPSLYAEHSVRNRYRNNKLRQDAQAAKREMVSFLSADVRVPLQYMLHVLPSLEGLQHTDRDALALMTTIRKYSQLVNDIADDLLLTVRIQENRYRSKLSQVGDLRALLDHQVHTVLYRNSLELMSGRRGPRCAVYITAPSLQIGVDERCLLAVLRHLLAFSTLGLRVDQDSTADEAQMLDEVDIRDFELIARVETAPPTQRTQLQALGLPASAQALSVTLRAEDARRQQWNASRRVEESTTAYICSTIAVCCGGSFTVTAQGSYELLLPCTTEESTVEPVALGSFGVPSAISQDTQDVMSMQGNDDASAVDSVGGHSSHTATRSVGSTSQRQVANETILSDSSDLEERIRQTAAMQARFKQQRVCVIVEDEVLGEVVDSVLRRLRLSGGDPVLRELQHGEYVPVAKLTFVTNYALCVELRARNYPGLIVLFSGAGRYLDDEQLTVVDYILPLPTADKHLCAFVDWLLDIYQEEVRRAADVERGGATTRAGRRRGARGSTNRSRAPSVADQASAMLGVNLDLQDGDNGGDPLVLLLLPGRLGLQLLQHAVQGLWRQWQQWDTWLFVTPLDAGTIESYYKWKMLNPSGSWYHRAGEMWVTIFPRMLVVFIVEMYLMKQALYSAVAGLIVCTVYLTKGCVYHWVLQPLGLRMWHYWAFASLLMPIFYTYAIFDGASTPFPSEHHLSLNTFLNKEFYGNRLGAEYVYSQFMTAAYSRLYGIYNLYPWSVITAMLLFVRSTQTNYLVIRTILSEQMTMLVELFFVQMLVLNVVYFIHLENTYRVEFKTAHEHILTKAYLDQCLAVCQLDVRRPLAVLLGKQEELLTMVADAAYRRRLSLDRAFVAKLEPLHTSRALLSEIVYELSMTSGSNGTLASPSTLAAGGSPRRLLLTRAVADIVSAFSAVEDSGSAVKIYAEIDVKLAVVQVDWPALSTLLTNLIHTALRNVREHCIEHPRNADLRNYILLKVVALESAERLPFIEPRTMLVSVSDSSDAAAKAVRAARVAWEAQAHPDFYRMQRNAERGKPSSNDPGRSGAGWKYGRSLCEALVRRVLPGALFETLSVEADLGTVQRFTFPYHITPQTRRAQDFIETETDKPHLTVDVVASEYLNDYNRVVLRRPVRSDVKSDNGEARQGRVLTYFSGVAAAQRGDVVRLVKQFESFGWSATVKFILSVPSMRSIEGCDCLIFDQQLETVEGVGISDTVLKMRVCGFNGVLAVVLQEGSRAGDAIREAILRSAATVDLILPSPLQQQHVQRLTEVMERKVARQAVCLNGN